MNSPVRFALAAALFAASPLAAQVADSPQGVNIDFADADLRAVVQSLARYLDLPVVFGAMGNQRVYLRTPRPVAASEVAGLLRTTLANHGYEMVVDGSSYVVRARGAGAGGAAGPGGAPPYAGAQQPPPMPGGMGGGAMQLFVISLRHARAADVAATVNALYGRGGALGEPGDRASSGTLGDGLRGNRIPPYGNQSASAVPQPGSTQQSSGFLGDVVIVPDARTNSLLVRASRNDYELVQAAVRQMDIRPLQVIVEVTIAEVRRNSDFSYALSAAVGQNRLRNSANTTVGGASGGNAREDLRVTARGIGGVDLELTLRAGVARGVVSILSRPIVFAANNEEAEIVVGDQRPFVQLQRTTDGGSQDQVVQYKDVGTRLNVLPTISGDGYVQLQVTQEVNTATAETGPQNAPVISTRSIRTALLVRDGETAVLGGLAEAQRERSSSGIPLLSSIPIIGGIFGSKARGSRDTELFIFLTPRVVRDDAELEAATDDVRRNGGSAGKTAAKTPAVILPRPSKTPAPRGAPAPAVPQPGSPVPQPVLPAPQPGLPPTPGLPLPTPGR